MAIYSKFEEWEHSSYLPFIKKIGGFAPESQKKIFNLNSTSIDLRFKDLEFELYQIIWYDLIQFVRPDRIPMFNFSHRCTEIAMQNGFPEDLIINHPNIVKGTEKVEMHKKLHDKDYVPKTVFTEEDAISQLKFPIIGKISETHSAVGVFQFKNQEELKKENKKKREVEGKTKIGMDLFSEKIDIDREFRMVVYVYKTGSVKLLYLAERSPNGEKIKGLRENQNLEFLKTDREGNFKWDLLDLNTEEFSPRVSHIVQDCINLNPGIQMLCVDFCIDKNDKYWYIECNRWPGMNFYLSISLYAHAYIDYYRDYSIQQKDSASYNYLMKLAKKHTEYTHAISPEYNMPKFEPNIFGKTYFDIQKN